MGSSRTKPIMVKQQFSFLNRSWPLILVAATVILFQIWKNVEADSLRSQIFKAKRTCASYQGENQQLKIQYELLRSVSRISEQASTLGLVFAEKPAAEIVVASDDMRKESLMSMSIQATYAVDAGRIK
jgi:hypothetical protein